MKQTAQERKDTPVYSGVLMYFPDAINALAQCSKAGNEQHNPGTPLGWDRSKSGDEMDALMRHAMEAGTVDDDRVRHSTKTLWRAAANLQKELEMAGEAPLSQYNGMTTEESIQHYLKNVKK
jgi:hypothetical protein